MGIETVATSRATGATKGHMKTQTEQTARNETAATAKHTPGPWSRESDVNPDGCDYYVLGADGALVADTHCPDGLGPVVDGEIEANTALIAAAPDLLAACKRVSVWLKQHGTPEIQGIACDVFNAIDKAEANP